MNTDYIADFMRWLDDIFPIQNSENKHSMVLQNNQLVLLIWSRMSTPWGGISKQWQVVVEEHDLETWESARAAMQRIIREVSNREVKLDIAVSRGKKYQKDNGPPQRPMIEADINELGKQCEEYLENDKNYPALNSMKAYFDAGGTLPLTIYAGPNFQFVDSLEKMRELFGEPAEMQEDIYSLRTDLEQAFNDLNQQVFKFCQPEDMRTRAVRVSELALKMADAYDLEREPIKKSTGKL